VAESSLLLLGTYNGNLLVYSILSSHGDDSDDDDIDIGTAKAPALQTVLSLDAPLYGVYVDVSRKRQSDGVSATDAKSHTASIMATLYLLLINKLHIYQVSIRI